MPTTLPFYLRSKDEKEVKAGKFTLVKIQLNDVDLRKTILSILKTCDLSTKFVDEIQEEVRPKDPKFSSRFWQTHSNSGERGDFSEFEDDPIYQSILMKRKIDAEPDTFK